MAALPVRAVRRQIRTLSTYTVHRNVECSSLKTVDFLTLNTAVFPKVKHKLQHSAQAGADFEDRASRKPFDWLSDSTLDGDWLYHFHV